MIKKDMDIIYDAGDTIYIRCPHCYIINDITRSYYWSGKNKGKKKPIASLFMCYKCDNNLWN